MRLENDGIAEAARHASGRFLGFGTVMLQDVKESIRECEQIKKIGLLGVEIGSNVNERGLYEIGSWRFSKRLNLSIWLS